MRPIRMQLAAACASFFLVAFSLADAARAQDPHGGSNSMEEEFRKKAEEISRLMRESEQLLLQITRVDDLVAKQAEIARRLAELESEQPANPSATESAETAEEAEARRERQRDELEQQQAEVERRLSELFERQGRAGQESVVKLIELLSSLPSGGGGGGSGQQRPRPEDQQQRQEQEQQEQKQEQEQPKDGKEQRDQNERDRRGAERDPDETGDGARMRRIEAWIATLPPALQERINRNDLSAIPARYRRLVREYTALRAQREAERTEER